MLCHEIEAALKMQHYYEALSSHRILPTSMDNEFAKKMMDNLIFSVIGWKIIQ